MKRLICSVFATLLVLLSSCAGSNPEGEDAAPVSSDSPEAPDAVPAETEASRVEDGLPDTDLEGWTMRILSHHDRLSDESTIYAYELTGETVNDLIYNRDLSLKKRFNCDFELIPGDGWGNDQTMLEASVTVSFFCSFINRFKIFLSWS